MKQYTLAYIITTSYKKPEVKDSKHKFIILTLPSRLFLDIAD